MTGRADFRDVTIDAGRKPEDWPTTRYEAKAAREGRTPIFLTFERV
jgi:tRNA G46 methylase TrmB